MRNLRNGKQRDQAHLLTIGSRAGTAFIAGKSDWQVSWGSDQKEVKAGQKMSKATDFLHKIQCSKTSVVYFQARDPDCCLHLTHATVDVSTY